MDDVYAACEKIKARGGKVIREAGPMQHGTRVLAFVEDPDGYKVVVHEIEPGLIYEDENVRVTAFRVEHGSWPHAFGYRFETPDRSIVFTNFVDFDMLFGHRRDVDGYAEALEYFDRRLPELMSALSGEDLLIICADHGCDPTHTGTDHTREYVPLLVRGGKAADLGTRTSFADLEQTIARGFGLEPLPAGTSFLEDL